MLNKVSVIFQYYSKMSAFVCVCVCACVLKVKTVVYPKHKLKCIQYTNITKA